MNSIKLSLNYEQYDPSGLAVFGKHISTCMTGNANMPSAISVLPLLDTAVVNLTNAINNQHPDTVIIDARVRDVRQRLKVLIRLAEMDGANTEEIALSSGFDLRMPTIRKPQVFSVKQGLLSGTADLSCSVYRNSAYIWEMISDPIDTNTWSVYDTSVVSTQQVTGLMPGNKYWFRVKTVLSKSKLPYSDPYMIHIV